MCDCCPELTDEELKRARRVTPEEHRMFVKAIKRKNANKNR